MEKNVIRFCKQTVNYNKFIFTKLALYGIILTYPLTENFPKINNLLQLIQSGFDNRKQQKSPSVFKKIVIATSGGISWRKSS